MEIVQSPMVTSSGGLGGARWVGCVGRATVSWLVAGDGASDDAAAGEALAFAAEVAVGLEFVQGGGDAGGALGEAGGEGLDVHAGAGREGLDVHGQSDGEAGERGVLGEVVADHREAGGVAGVVVDETARVGMGFARVTGLGAGGRARVLGIHREAAFFLGGQALALGLQSRRGPLHVCGRVAVSVGQATGLKSS